MKRSEVTPSSNAIFAGHGPHVAVNGLDKYYEVHQDGPPLAVCFTAGASVGGIPSYARDRLTPDQKLQFGLGASSSPRKEPPTGAMITVTSLAG